jgi:hypothetical protein
MTRIVLGGLLAGLVINISQFVLNGVVVAAEMEAALARLNVPPVTANAIAIFLAMGFALGIVTVWLYAAIRPGFDGSVAAAACAASLVWLLAYGWGNIGSMVLGILPARMVLIALLWGLVELAIAALVGAKVYRDRPEARLTSPPMGA